jgi:hypothetical protein
MVQRYVTALALAAGALVCNPASARTTLDASEWRVDIGRFKVGETKECNVEIRNAGETPAAIDHVATSCGCLSAVMDSNTIRPGANAMLRIVVERQYPGEFSYSVLVFPKDADTSRPLKIEVRGEARLSATGQIGWRGGLLQDVTYPNPIDMGIRDSSRASPVVYLMPAEGFDLHDSLVDVNSVHFCMEKATYEPSASLPGDGSKGRLGILLKPRKPLGPGRLRDLLCISLRDGSKLYLSIVCRIVGNVYLEQDEIHLGELACSPERSLPILFSDGTKVWDGVHWEATGFLRDAIAIQDERREQGTGILLRLSIDRAKLSTLPKGYLFGRVRVYNEISDAPLYVFIDGFN